MSFHRNIHHCQNITVKYIRQLSLGEAVFPKQALFDIYLLVKGSEYILWQHYHPHSTQIQQHTGWIVTRIHLLCVDIFYNENYFTTYVWLLLWWLSFHHRIMWNINSVSCIKAFCDGYQYPAAPEKEIIPHTLLLSLDSVNKHIQLLKPSRSHLRRVAVTNQCTRTESPPVRISSCMLNAHNNTIYMYMFIPWPLWSML